MSVISIIYKLSPLKPSKFGYLSPMIKFGGGHNNVTDMPLRANVAHFTARFFFRRLNLLLASKV